MIFNLFQNNNFAIPSLTLWVLAWTFSVLGIIALISLILYTKYGREISIKFSVITIVIASSFLGFAIHFFLISFGL